MKRFVVTHEHLALFRAANVSWDPGCEGAPGVDCKRPYGNGDVGRDMGRILGWEPGGEDEDGDPDYTDAQRDQLEALHRQTETALQIVLATGDFRPGVYGASPYDRDWRLVEADGGWSDPSVELDGLLPDEALLRLAMQNTARRIAKRACPRPQYVTEVFGGRFARAVSDLFGHGKKYALIMCARFGFDPETGKDLWRRD